MRLRGLYLIGFTAAALAAGSAASAAAEFCVSCDGPPAQYTCQFDDSVANTDDSRLRLTCITELARAGGHAACSVDRTRVPPCGGEVRHMALPDAGGSIVPGLAGAAPSDAPAAPGAAPSAAPGSAPEADGVGPSPAETTAVPNGEPGPAGQPGETAGAEHDAATTEAASEDKGPPQTVQEMVEQSAKSTGSALKKTGEAASNAAEKTGSALQDAGKAVGKAAKKTWNCITSLFGDC